MAKVGNTSKLPQNRFYGVKCLFFDGPCKKVYTDEVKNISRSDAMHALKSYLRHPRVISATIYLKNPYVKYQEKTFRGPKYNDYRVENT